MKLSASANGIICLPGWLLGEGISSFDMAGNATALTHIPYNLHKNKFLPFRDCVTWI